MAKYINADQFDGYLVNIAKHFAKTEKESALMGRVMYCLSKMPAVDMKQSNEWNFVNENPQSLPSTNRNVLIAYHMNYADGLLLTIGLYGDISFGGHCMGKQGWHSPVHDWFDVTVVAWMDLPELPKIEGGENNV